MKSWQPVFFHSRWGQCKHCGHAELYPVVKVPSRELNQLEIEKPRRLRDTPCARCAVPLGRAANKRARNLRKRRIRREQVVRRVSDLAQRWAMPSATIRRPRPRRAAAEKPVETSAVVVARRKRADR